jgi:hypothetical protein
MLKKHSRIFLYTERRKDINHHRYLEHTSFISFTIMYFPAKEAVATVSS